MKKGISFLYAFDVGNRDIENFGANVLRVTSTAQGDFDKGNITTESVKHIWRSANSLTLHEIVLKADVVAELDTFAILGHNFTGNAVVRVQGNYDDEWTAPPFNKIVPIDEDSNNLIVCDDAFGGEFTHYRVTILDPSNPCGYLEVGRVIGGRAFTFVENEDITDNYTIDHDDKSESMQTQGYYRASNENVIVRSFKGSFSKLSTVIGKNDNFKSFRKMFKTIKTTRPFLTILERDNPQVFNIWGQLKDLPSESYDVNKYVSYSINVLEVF